MYIYIYISICIQRDCTYIMGISYISYITVSHSMGFQAFLNPTTPVTAVRPCGTSAPKMAAWPAWGLGSSVNRASTGSPVAGCHPKNQLQSLEIVSKWLSSIIGMKINDHGKNIILCQLVSALKWFKGYSGRTRDVSDVSDVSDSQELSMCIPKNC